MCVCTVYTYIRYFKTKYKFSVDYFLRKFWYFPDPWHSAANLYLVLCPYDHIIDFKYETSIFLGVFVLYDTSKIKRKQYIMYNFKYKLCTVNNIFFVPSNHFLKIAKNNLLNCGHFFVIFTTTAYVNFLS